MAWYVMPVHRVAHINPTGTGSAATTGYPLGNIRTLDPNIRASFAASAPVLTWDRGAAGMAQIDAAALINHTIIGSGDTLIIAKSTDNFAANNVTVATLTPAATKDGKDFFSKLTAFTDRYVRATFSASPTVFGVLTLGQAWSIGKAQLSFSWAGQGASPPVPNASGIYSVGGLHYASRVIHATFRNVSLATAQAVMAAWARPYTWSYGASFDLMDGIGGGSGSNPTVLVDDSGNVFYGPATINYSQWSTTLAELEITLAELTYPTGGN